MTKIEVFSSELVTEENPNGRGMLDLDVPADIVIFGGQEAVGFYMRGQKISAEMHRMAETELIRREEIEPK